MATGTLVDVVMPQMGVSVSEGTITKWLKQPGEAVSADEPLLEISTDKVDTEVPSPATGIVQEVLAQEGETVDVGTKLATIAPEGADAPMPDVPEPATQAAAAESESVSSSEADTPTAETVEDVEPAAAPAEPAPKAEPAPAPSPAPSAGGGDNGKAFVSPVVGRIASEHGVDVSQVSGTGRGGRVTKKDILKFIESGGAAAAPAEPAPAAQPSLPRGPRQRLLLPPSRPMASPSSR